MGAEITKRTDEQEERRNGERTEKTNNRQDQFKISRLLRSTLVAPFLLLIRVLRILRALYRVERLSCLCDSVADSLASLPFLSRTFRNSSCPLHLVRLQSRAWLSRRKSAHGCTTLRAASREHRVLREPQCSNSPLCSFFHPSRFFRSAGSDKDVRRLWRACKGEQR